MLILSTLPDATDVKISNVTKVNNLIPPPNHF